MLHKTTSLFSLSFSVQVTFVSFMLCLLISNTVTHSHGHRSGIQAQLIQKFVGLIHPEQIHIAFGKTPQDIVIMWATKKDVKFSIEIAKASNQLQKIESERFELKRPGIAAARYLHHIYLSNLTPGEKYVYRIVGESGANSKIFSFKVPNNTPKNVHTFMILADMGLSSKTLKFLTYEAATGMYEAVFHVGDIAYSLHRDNGNFGDLFLKETEKFAAKVPYMTVPGDHERFDDFFHYRHRFSMPNANWPMPADQLWYSIDIGPIHFIALNTEVFYTLTDQQKQQLEWLKDDLYSANLQRSQHPWVIVLGHRPMYCSQTSDISVADCENDTCTIRSSLEDLFFEEGVDVYISGHQHNYERSWPLYRGKVFQRSYINPKAPVHIINGAMGYQYQTETFLKTKNWSAFSSSDPRKELYGKLEVLNSTHLMWDVYCAANNELIDSILIIQRRHGLFGKAGDDAYKNMMKLQQLPPAPFHWHPPASTENKEEKPLFQVLYALPPSTRKFYLMILCITLMSILVCLMCVPKVRRTVCRAAKI